MIQLPNSFKHVNVLVIGDIMLDRYIWGRVQRISPEAPVPIVGVQRSTETLGGAGYVANNLSGLGCSATIIGLCGSDTTAEALKALLSQKGIVERMVVDPSRPTTTKTKIWAQKQQIIRLDEETIIPPSLEVSQRLKETIEEEIIKCQVVVISDYGKGLFQTDDLIQATIALARRRKIPILVDPKGKNWQRYKNATCITPNTAELETVAGVTFEEDEGALIDYARKILQQLGLDYLLVTRGAQGMCLVGSQIDPLQISSHAREVFDVSGAGDTVIATLAAGLAAGLTFEEGCRIANLAAGIVVGKLGTQPILFSELAAAVDYKRFQHQFPYSTAKIAALDTALAIVIDWKAAGARIIFTNGCFDLLHPGHISLLHQASAMGDRLIVGLNSDSSVKRLKGDRRPILGEQDRASLLSALECVDLVIIFDEDTPLELIKKLQPDVLVKGSDYLKNQVVGRRIVEGYGGKVRLVQLMPGYSTTELTNKINQ